MAHFQWNGYLFFKNIKLERDILEKGGGSLLQKRRVRYQVIRENADKLPHYQNMQISLCRSQQLL